MSTLHGDGELETLLRESLAARAESVHPAGDGLSRIQQRVTGRRHRARWLRPALAVGVAAVVTAGGVGAYVALSGPSGTQSVEVPPARHSSPQPTPTPDVSTPTAPVFPPRGIFPFLTRSQEQSWEAGGGANGPQPWAASPAQCALRFVADMLGQPSVSAVTDTSISSDGRAATVVLGRKLNAAPSRVIGVTKVRLVKYGAAWVVIGADDAGEMMTVTSPAPGGNVDSPVVVTGPGFGVDEVVTVELRSVHAHGPIGTQAHASFGQGTPTWSATLRFPTPTDPAAAVVVTDVSAADGGPGRIVVVPVRFGGPATYPARFVGVKNGRVTLFTSRNGAALKYLTTQQPGGGPSDPRVEGGNVYFVQGSGTCSNALMSVPISGGATRKVATPDNGFAIANFAVSRDASKVALFEHACGNTSPQGRLVARDLLTGVDHVVRDYPSFPPMVTGDPSWEPDGQHLDAFTRTGMGGGIGRYDAFDTRTPPQTCKANAGQLQSAPLEVDGRGVLWFAAFNGSSTDIYACDRSEKVFTLRGVNLTGIDVSADGSSLLLTDDAGRLWRWNQGQTVQLTPSVRLAQASWE